MWRKLENIFTGILKRSFTRYGVYKTKSTNVCNAQVQVESNQTIVQVIDEQ